jgi:RecA-family ATPase
VDVAALLTTPPPALDWVLPGVLPAGEVGLLVGTDGGGKSALLAELALAVALGVPWASPVPQQPGLIPAPTAGRVLYIAGEDDTAEYHRRFAAARAALQLPAPPVGQVWLWPLESHPWHLMEAHRQAATPTETTAAERLAAVMRQIAPRLVVLDPLIMLHGLSEADPQHMDSLMRLLIRLARSVPGCAILAAHHAGQASIAKRPRRATTPNVMSRLRNGSEKTISSRAWSSAPLIRPAAIMTKLAKRTSGRPKIWRERQDMRAPVQPTETMRRVPSEGYARVAATLAAKPTAVA